ncbi:MAG: Lsr2 dimerization domain-containing protein [Mycobacterium sp.]
MALNVVFTDDFDDSSTADETVEFEIDGARYEIDLSKQNAMRLRGDLQPWINAARRTGGRRRLRRSSEAAGQAAAAAERRTAIRVWARNNGTALRCTAGSPARCWTHTTSRSPGEADNRSH